MRYASPVPINKDCSNFSDGEQSYRARWKNVLMMRAQFKIGISSGWLVNKPLEGMRNLRASLIILGAKKLRGVFRCEQQLYNSISLLHR